ncbi:MAG: T9SS type A sorting domain-containing protein [Saprospiraceae bacterium]|nr:T9SS type A sorting domain-containing protein [Saprospiraceae bacterium]
MMKDQVSVPRRGNFLAQEDIIGNTLYDLQSNNASQSRLVVNPDGSKAATWMLSQLPDFSERGTGFNEFDGNSWQTRPTVRLEANLRTGWPSLIQLGDGSFHITTHTGGTNLHSLTRAPGVAQWTESSVPNNVPVGVLWPRTAVGGPDSLTVHLLALTTPPFLQGGAAYLGVDGHLLYYRSLDGGQTWDVLDQVIPGLDSTGYGLISADSYTIVASGDNVVVIVFGEWGDIAAFKSVDNGDSWSKIVISDFPLDGYSIDEGYTTADIPADPFAPDSLAIYTSDGTGAALLDHDGVLHVAWADMYVADNDTTDGNSSFYPGWSGVTYWNENLSEPVFVGSFLDYNGNDTIDLSLINIPAYGSSTTSMPVIGIDSDGFVYVAYSMVSEAHFNDLDQQNYRHIVGTRSEDGGQTWGDLFDIINSDLVDPDVVEFVEAVYPSAWPYVDDRFHIIYQQDFFPGHTFQDSLDPAADNLIAYTGVPKESFAGGMTSVRQNRNELSARIFPNLVSDQLTVLIEAEQSAGATIRIITTSGNAVHQESGMPSRFIHDCSDLLPGMYLITLQSRDKHFTAKFVKI